MVEKKVSNKESESDQISENLNQENSSIVSVEQNMVCGIVMPISSIDGVSESHWIDVKNIIQSSIKDAGFSPNLVSDADEVGIIQQRIIQNLYSNPIVVCDVSCKNPNVMFELGMRLAFDKPTIIIKDDKTDYSFDTSVIEHIEYPRDLRFNNIIRFKLKLTEKIQATFEKSREKDYSTFLKNFKILHVERLDVKELSPEQFMLEKLSNIESELLFLRKEKYSKEKFYKNKNLNIVRFTQFVDLKIIDLFEYCDNFKKILNDEGFNSIKGLVSYDFHPDPKGFEIVVHHSNEAFDLSFSKACEDIIDLVNEKMQILNMCKL